MINSGWTGAFAKIYFTRSGPAGKSVVRNPTPVASFASFAVKFQISSARA